ncbi:MAG: hypothetical protein BGO48_04130 [Mucilaginibacter sp. 44-25]|nr:MAG: hypothetical protein BGO48_04130 [Mucilaginibacter sp. 44-25]
MARNKRERAAAHRTVHYARKIQRRPLWIKIIRIFGMIILAIGMLLIIIEAVIQYVHVIRKH